jgi:iron complex outermembrane receptor protein
MPERRYSVVLLYGYKGRQVTIIRHPLKITLEDIVALEEAIVAVGYGTMRKSDLTGAISSVSSEKFRKGSSLHREFCRVKWPV